VERHDFIAVGDVMIDIAVTGEALARGGHVSGQVRVSAGGSAANAAAWARAAGAAAAVVGRVGDDFAGRALQAALSERGIEALLTVDGDRPTGAVVTLGSTVVAERGANATFAPGDVPDRLEAGAVLVSGYVLLHDDTEAAVRAALERADASWIAVDAASARLLDRYGRERFFDATSAASVLLLNEDEAYALTGDDPERAARALGDSYRLVCVKRGPAGVVAVLDGQVLTAAGPPLEAVATMGAGDAFAGVLLALLAQGRTLADALDEAARAGAAAVTSAAGWPSMQY
jgi:sugar/nucleoside kinase (ribokinase family)